MLFQSVLLFMLLLPNISINVWMHVQTSTFLLQHLLQDELQFVEVLKTHYKEYITNDHNTSIAKQIQNYINNIYLNYNPGYDLETYVSNPLNALGLIRRTSHDFRECLAQIFQNKSCI